LKLLNKYNLPQSIVNIIKKNIYKPTPDKMRVTELINAPLVKKLTMEHWDEIEIDVSDRLWALLGTAVHYILKGGAPEDSIEEEQLSASIGGITIVGTSDLYHNKGIEDWKITSVYSFLLGMKPVWVAQLNIYKWLWKENGFPVERLNINAILRDFMKSKTLSDQNYPKIPFQTAKIPIWKYDYTVKYILERIRLHNQEDPPECTPEEKWQRPTTYAVMKKGRKRAMRVLNSYEEAKDWIGDQDLYIEERKGSNIKCEQYCDVNKFCKYYQRDLKKQLK